AFIVTADGEAAAGFAEGVELVDEDDAGGLALRLAEEVAHPAGADADEELDEVGAAHREEGDIRLAGDGLAEQCLARTGRTHEQHAFGNPSAEGLVLLGCLEEINDLAQLRHRLVDAGDVLEGDLQVLLGVELVLAAAKRQGSAAARHPAHEEEAEQEDR